MNCSIYDYARLGIVHCMAYPSCNESEDQFVSTLKEILVDPFFSVVEIGQLPFSTLNESISSLIHSSKCQLTYSAHSRLFRNGLNINSLNDEERQRAVVEMKKGIDEAYSWNALNFQFLSRQWEESTKEANLEALIKSTVEICNYAKLKGSMKVCLEIFDYDIDKCSLIGKGELAARYCKEVIKSCDNFGLMVDLSHIPMIRESIDNHIDPIKDYIIHAHMGNTVISNKDSIAYGDNHPRFGYPESENDIEELTYYLRKLIEIGYLNKKNRPVLSFEVKPQGDEDSALVVANAKRSLMEAWRRV